MKKLIIITIVSLFSTGVVYAFSPQYGISNGLVGYWSFDTRANKWTTSTTGNTLDISNASANGTFTNMSRTVTPVKGKVNEALDFDGSNDSVQVTSTAVRITGDITLSIWANADTFNAGAYNNALMGYVSTSVTDLEADNWLYYFSIDNGTHLLRSFHESGAGVDNAMISTVGATTADPGEWHHYAVVRDTTANTYTYYYDGQQLGSVVTYSSGDPTGGTNGTHMRIGQHITTSTNIFNGKLDEARIYNRALSAQEINQIYRLGLSGYGR